MPIVCYECKTCGKKMEKLVSNKDRDSQICDCTESSKLEEILPDTFNFSLKGTWFKNSGRY